MPIIFSGNITIIIIYLILFSFIEIKRRITFASLNSCSRFFNFKIQWISDSNVRTSSICKQSTVSNAAQSWSYTHFVTCLLKTISNNQMQWNFVFFSIWKLQTANSCRLVTCPLLFIINNFNRCTFDSCRSLNLYSLVFEINFEIDCNWLQEGERISMNSYFW